jgi:redox-sensitive bicupin YhaK (pirin superfamily)
MIHLIRAAQHYHNAHGWLSTYHHFSFNDYYDPSNMNWASLRVLNEDAIAPASGFPLHPHHDMEIVTYVLSGALQHEDSLGNKGITRAGEVQYMCAGTGVLHAEFNASKTEPVHLLQMWITPEKNGLKPHWEQKAFSREEKTNTWLCTVSPKKKDGALTIHQQAKFYVSILKKGKKIVWNPEYDKQYLFVINGNILLNKKTLFTQDAAKIAGEKSIELEAIENSHVVAWDLSDDKNENDEEN